MTESIEASPCTLFGRDASTPRDAGIPALLAPAKRKLDASPFATQEAQPPQCAAGRAGRLVIVGSGIKSLAQMTLEAIGHIAAADEVFHAVADPLAETFIERHARRSYDLCMLYDDDKPRIRTYVQMAEVIMRAVRQGRYVVGVFYGHPGVFVTPSHRAIAIARQEGYQAEMLAGVSAEDNLFADIGFDPSHPGCQTLEATDLLLRSRPLLTDMHVVIFQVGVVGDHTFNFDRFQNRGFQIFIERLIASYGEDHDVYHYVASIYSPCRPVVERHRLGEFRDPELAARVTVVSTFYVPPLGGSTHIAQAIAHGLSKTPGKAGYAGPGASGDLYGPAERAAIDELDRHRIPHNYKTPNLTPSMYDAMYALATDPAARHAFERDPDAFLCANANLRADERDALRSARMRLIHGSMRDGPGAGPRA